MRLAGTKKGGLLFMTACLATTACVLQSARKAAEPGLAVEEVTPGGAAARAGIAPGDVLLRWERSPTPPANPRAASGPFGSPFDLTVIEHDQAPRGAIRVSGLRNGSPQAWQIPPGKWNLLAAPQLSGEQLQEYHRGLEGIKSADQAAGLASWQRLAAALAEKGDAENAAALHLRIAKVQEKAGDRSGAAATYENILATVAAGCTPAANREIRLRLGALLIGAGELGRADRLLSDLLPAYRASSGESLQHAETLDMLGRVSLLRGDSQAAERHLTDALAIAERLAPGSLHVATELGNLGLIEQSLGKIAVAEDLQRRALEIDQRLLPESLDIASDLTNLASLEESHRDFAAALEDYRKALAIRERLDPDSIDVARALHNVGGVLLSLGDPGAGTMFERSLELRKRLHTGDLDQVETLSGLGTAAWSQHQYAPAESWLKQALTIQEALGNGTVTHAVILSNLADVLLEEGRLAEAEEKSRLALEIFRNKTPESEREATAYRDLAVILRKAGKTGDARELYEKSLSSLETAGRILFGSGQKRSTFLASHAAYYREDIDLLLELGRQEEAFHVLERYRARGLLALLAERDLAFGNEIPAQLESERRSANTDYEHVLGEFAKLSADSPKKDWAALQERLTEARRRQDFVRDRIRAASPRLAALRDPEPFDLKATAQALDPGTVLLSYMIGEERSYLFVVGPENDHFAVYPIKMGQKTLGDEVHRLRNLIEQRTEAARPPALQAAAASLTSLLLVPAVREITAAKRLLVIPDGPLHILPFAILGDPAGPGFLIETKPIHTAASATVFAEIKNHRETRPLLIFAFGDPVYPAPRGTPPEDLVLRAARRDGLRFDPLPGTRAEVEALGGLFPSQSRLFLGADATEERAKALGTEPSIVHFASHALFNERFPLDSALVLSIPEHSRVGQENGLLQAWEIFEQVHLNADLVTLSACESALGKEQGGEGLIGLTRAFQYAGARSILASLWSVGDTGAAELMKRFYGYLKSGASKDEALRHAQADLLQGAGGSEWSIPFHWAAFELSGDWQ